jgi:hypothetical protein
MEWGFIFGLFVAPMLAGAAGGLVYWLVAGRPEAGKANDK